METTKAKVSRGKKQSANDTCKSARPVCKISKITLYRLWIALTEKGENEKSALARAIECTQNGTYKVTSALPDNKDDIKGRVKVGDKTFYLVPASVGMKGVFSAIISYFDILDAQRIWAKKLANTKNFEEWSNTVDAQRQFRAVEMLTGKDLTDDEKHKLYAVYLNDRGLAEKTAK